MRLSRAPDFSSGALAIAPARANAGVGSVARLDHCHARVARRPRGAAAERGRMRGIPGAGTRPGPRRRHTREGLLARDQGHHNDAAMALVHSTQVFEELGDRNSWAHATRNLGELRRRQRRFGEAAACLDRPLVSFGSSPTLRTGAGAPRELQDRGGRRQPPAVSPQRARRRSVQSGADLSQPRVSVAQG